MNAFKGCVNRECESYKHRIHYKDDYEFCPHCGERLEYVCADCWKVLDHNKSRYCEVCQAKRDQKREVRIQQARDLAKAVPVAAVAKYALNNKEKILDIAKKVVKK